jgi:t-SNARE complex subunit (syntaxin)
MQTNNTDIDKRFDVVLDDMSESLSRLKTVATSTSSELENQNELIDDVTKDVDSTDTQIQKTTKKVKRMIETMSCIPYKTTGCVLILVLIIFILVLLLIFG